MRTFIFDTDWGEDCDDAVAARILLRAAKRGEVKLLGMGINTLTEYAAPSLYAFCENEGYIVPIGIDTTCPKTEWENRYQVRLAKRTDKCASDFRDATKLYRKLLASSNGNVEIITVGFLQIIEKLLKSEPDEISPKTGYELFKEKVAKVWTMGGKWTADGEKEFNFCYTPFACQASSYVLENCPCEIVLLGWEIGSNLYTGSKLSETDVLRQVLLDWGCPQGRESWDPMTVVLALTGDIEKAGYKAVKGTGRVDPQTGKNYFVKDENGKHTYVIKSQPNSYYTDAIDELIK